MNWFARLKLNSSLYPDWIHLLLAYGIVLTFAAHKWIAFAFVASWAFWVELIFDPREERNTTTPNWTDARDILDYLSGAVLALGVIWIRSKV